MKEYGDKSYKWWKNKINNDGFYKVEETSDEIIVACNDASITFNKKTMDYKATGFGGWLAFTTYPIYDDWKALITAWLNEKFANSYWA